jgi:hypothetical protein
MLLVAQSMSARGCFLPVKRTLIATLALAAALVACGGETTGTACPADAPDPAPTPPYSQDTELADRIPDEVGGEAFDVQTVCLTVYDPGGLTVSDAMLEEVGVGRQEVTLAFSPSPNVAGSSDFIGITAWRYAGASEDDIRQAFLAMLEEAEIPVEQQTIGGKEVDMALFHAYYAADDTLYSVLGAEDRVAELLEALP